MYRKDEDNIKYSIAFDSALEKTGYAVFKDEQVIDYGCIVTKKNKPISERILYLNNYADHLFMGLEDVGFDIAFEKTIFVPGNRKDTAINIGIAKGSIVCALKGQLFQTKVYEYAPATIKASVAHGRASKEEVRKAVKLLTKIDSSDNNITDAIAIGLCHIGKMKLNRLILK